MTSVPTLGTLPCRTSPLPDAVAADLLALLPARGALAWVRGGEGLVGWGEAGRLEVRGPDRFARAAAWWADFVAALDVADEVGGPGSGPVAFGSFGFADGPASSVLVVPKVVVGRRGGRAWLTVLGGGAPRLAARAAAGPAVQAARGRRVRWSAGAVPPLAFRAGVAEAVRRIRAGDLDKVVLALDLVADCPDPVDVPVLLRRLAARYPSCWTFSCDGLVGATPELLVRRTGRRVLSRVLAGTATRGGADDATLAGLLLSSAKDRAEHEPAVRSVVDALRPLAGDVSVTDAVVLELANVLHLASDVTATLRGEASALEVAGALHPPGAVAGSPTAAALRLLAEVEGLDRGRYAAPVGWVDARGDGEWGLALRCGEVAGSRLRLFAGCGIVAGSDPDAELAEAQAKFLPMRDAVEAAPL